jgi:hypothetical protein
MMAGAEDTDSPQTRTDGQLRFRKTEKKIRYPSGSPLGHRHAFCNGRMAVKENDL